MRWIADENSVSFTALFLHHSVTLVSFISGGPVLKILQAAVKCSFELHTDTAVENAEVRAILAVNCIVSGRSAGAPGSQINEGMISFCKSNNSVSLFV